MNEERWWRRISGSSSICLFNAFRLTKAFRNWNYRKIQIGRSSRRMYLPSYSSCMQSTWKCISILLLIFFSAWVCTHHNNVGEITKNSLIVQLGATALDLGLFSVARFAREVTIKETFMEEFLCNFRVLQKQDFSVCTYVQILATFLSRKKVWALGTLYL